MKPCICHQHTPPVAYQPVYRGQPCPVCGMTVTLEDRYRQQVKRLPTPKVLTFTPAVPRQHVKRIYLRLPDSACPCGNPIRPWRRFCSWSCSSKTHTGPRRKRTTLTLAERRCQWEENRKRRRLQARLSGGHHAS